MIHTVARCFVMGLNSERCFVRQFCPYMQSVIDQNVFIWHMTIYYCSDSNPKVVRSNTKMKFNYMLFIRQVRKWEEINNINLIQNKSRVAVVK